MPLYCIKDSYIQVKTVKNPQEAVNKYNSEPQCSEHSTVWESCEHEGLLYNFRTVAAVLLKH